MNIKLQVEIEHDTETGWFTAVCPSLPGCITQAETMAELEKNIVEVITMWFEVEHDKQKAALVEPGG